MRDLELIHIADTAALPPELVDAAYVAASPGGVLDDTTLTDPAFTDAKAYAKPSLGGEYGVGRSAILGTTYDDGGEAALGEMPIVVVTAPVVPTPQIVWPGRAANNTSFLNLFPWHKSPPQGLDQNNPNPPPAVVVVTPSGITVTGNTLVGNTGNAAFSGPAARNATVTLDYAINGGPMQQVTIAILIGDTGSQIAAKVRSAIDAVFGLDASGTGGTVNVVGLGGVLTAFNLSVS